MGGGGGARILHIIKRVSCCKLFPLADPGEIAFTHSYSAKFHPHYCMAPEWIRSLPVTCLPFQAQLDCFQGFGSTSKAPMASLVSGMRTEAHFGWIRGSGTDGHRVCKYSIL